MAILTKAQLEALNQSSFADNTTGAITPEILRTYNTATIDTLVDSLDTGSFLINTASFATTGSNTFIGNQTLSGSILPLVANQGDLGNDTYPFNSVTVNGQVKASSINASSRNSLGTIRMGDESFPLSFLQAREIVADGSGADTHMYYGTGSAVDALREIVYTQSGSNADFAAVSASFNSRINAITGSGGGSGATLGANTFTGSQTISLSNGEFRITNPDNPSYGTVSFGLSNASQGGIYFKQSGSIIIEGAPNDRKLTFYATGSFGAGVQIGPGESYGNNAFIYPTGSRVAIGGPYEGGVSDTMLIGQRNSSTPTRFTNVDVTIDNDLELTGSQTIGGYLSITGNNGAPFQYALVTTNGIRVNQSVSTSGLNISGSATTEALNSYYPNTLWQHAGNVTFGNQIGGVGSGSITISANGGGVASISGSQTNIAGVDFIPFSASVVSRINSISGLTGSFATTGSNTFTGNQTINANLIANKVSVYDFDSLYLGSQLGGTTANGTFFGYGSTSYSFIVGAYAGGFDNELKINADSTGITFSDFNGASYPSFLQLLPNTGTNPAPILTRGVEITGSVKLNPASVSTNAWYILPFISASTISKDSVDTLFYNPSQNVLQVSASATGVSNFGPSAISIVSGSGTTSYASSISKTSIVSSIEGYNIGMSGNPSKIGAPSLASNTKPGIFALSSSAVPYVAIELEPSQSFIDGRVTIKRPLVLEQPITGSTTINGNTTINANLIANKVSVYNFDSLGLGSQMGGTTANGTFFGYGSTDYTAYIGAYGSGFDNELQIYANSAGIEFRDFNGSSYPSWLKLSPNTGANPAPIFSRGLVSTGSVTIASGSGDLYVHGHKQFNGGMFQNNTTLSGSAGVSQSIALPVTDLSYGVTIANNSQITMTNAGVYNIQFSAQIETAAGADSVYIWFKKNGTNITDSATKVVLANNTAQTMTVNILQEANANDYYELVWQSTNGNARILSEAASGNIPLIPAVIATVTQLR